MRQKMHRMGTNVKEGKASMDNSCQKFRHLFGLAFISLFFLFQLTSAGWTNSATPRVFASAEAAADALIEAIEKKDVEALLSVLGSDTKKWITSGDLVSDRAALEDFVVAIRERTGLEKDGDDYAIFVTGEDRFPFAFPIVKGADGWSFDQKLGEEEILTRRIGKNELTTIQVLKSIADAQHEYASEDRNGDGLLAYAKKAGSSDGKKDGLYWPTTANEKASPLGLLVAEAAEAGYGAREGAKPDKNTSRPFNGYHFKLLKKQGFHAPGGARDYIVNDRMIGGFAVLAYPSRYGNSGIMTFMISHDGDVYEADLGPETEATAKAITSFDPGPGWHD
jgi:Protein of unknown function (DUF2950)